MKSLNVLQPKLVRFLKEKNLNGYSFLNKQFACFMFPYPIIGGGSGSGSIDSVFMYDDEEGTDLNIPMIYLVLSKDRIKNDYLYKFTIKVLSDSKIWNTGITDFNPGVDYFVNETLAAKLRLNNVAIKNDYILPNVLTAADDLSEFWAISKADELNELLSNAAAENDVLDYTYSEDQLKDFYATFTGIILNDTKIAYVDKLANNNPIYEAVLNYYTDHQSDAASINLQLLLSSTITADTSNTMSTMCSCNSKTSTSFDTKPCTEKYADAMTSWLIEMLGNTQFYQDWFALRNGNPNEAMCDDLIKFITEFINLDLDLSLSSTTNTMTMCKCPDTSSDKSAANYAILYNYLKVLDWVKAGQMCENKNKIKVYGEDFAALLPKLQF